MLFPRCFLPLCFLLAVGAMAASAAAESAPQPERPNILLILTDDMRYDHASAFGHAYLQTPHIDRLASEGTVFTRAYVTTPLCGPSRGSVLTGLLPGRHGTRNHMGIKEKDYPDGPFLPGLMQKLGYRTGLVGKWFQGQDTIPRPEFDRWFANHGVESAGGLPRAEQMKIYTKNIYSRTRYNVDGKHTVTGNYNTDDMFDEAARFATEQSDQPFFLFLSPFAPHFPYVPAPRHAGTYEGKGVPESPNLRLDLLKPGHRKRDIVSAAKQAEMMLAIDEGLGRLMEALRQSGQLDNTLIVFTSDNGILFGEHGDRTKNLPWEESVRVPFVVRYPALYKAGTTTDQLVSLADLFPAFVSLGGGTPPEGLYGRNFLPGHPPRQDVVCLGYDMKTANPSVPDWASLIEATRKLTVDADGRPASLYAVSEDPYEMKDLAAEPNEAKKIASMKARLAAILRENGTEAEAKMVEASETTPPSSSH